MMEHVLSRDDESYTNIMKGTIEEQNASIRPRYLYISQLKKICRDRELCRMTKVAYQRS